MEHVTKVFNKYKLAASISDSRTAADYLHSFYHFFAKSLMSSRVRLRKHLKNVYVIHDTQTRRVFIVSLVQQAAQERSSGPVPGGKKLTVAYVHVMNLMNGEKIVPKTELVVRGKLCGTVKL